MAAKMKGMLEGGVGGGGGIASLISFGNLEGMLDKLSEQQDGINESVRRLPRPPCLTEVARPTLTPARGLADEPAADDDCDARHEGGPR